MTYAYGTHGAPGLGGGAPGLPRRGKVRGEVLFAIPGTYLWTVPEDVDSVCALAVAGGGNATAGIDPNASLYYISAAGGGGATAWDNNLPVTPGEVIAIVVGANGGLSYFRDTSTVAAGAGIAGDFTTGALGAATVGGTGGQVLAGKGFPGGTGGLGRNQTSSGATGGTAGGYSAAGAGGVNSSGAVSINGVAGNGGAGSSGSILIIGSASTAHGSGGIGPFGEGQSGAAPTAGTSGRGGSGGENGGFGSNNSVTTAPPGRFGAGASIASPIGMGTLPGAPGCVRVLWGADRAFPSTDVGPS